MILNLSNVTNIAAQSRGGDCAGKKLVLQEQEKITKFLNAISEQIQKVSEQLKETKTFKKGLLNQLFVN